MTKTSSFRLRALMLLCLSFSALTGLTSCSNRMDPTDRVIAGGLIGAGVGAAIGSGGGVGAAAGAGIGAAAGMLVGLVWE